MKRRNRHCRKHPCHHRHVMAACPGHELAVILDRPPAVKKGGDVARLLGILDRLPTKSGDHPQPFTR